MPKALRFALFADKHTEYDIAACHPVIFAHFAGSAFPIIQSVTRRMLAQDMDEFRASVPGGKRAISAYVNAVGSDNFFHAS